MIRGTQVRTAVVAAAALALLAGGAPAYAQGKHANGTPAPRFTQINQVSDQPGVAALTDADAVNSWGLALGPTTPLWVSNNATATATVYAGGVNGAAVTKTRRVTIPGGAPTGTVFNDTGEFEVPGTSAPAFFIFVSETGNVTAWNPAAGAAAVTVAHTDGAIYKGVSILRTPFGPWLLATDFHNNHIDVFDGQFQKVNLSQSFFRDKKIPTGYAPFNVLVVGDKIYVTYAKQDADAEDDVAGPGLGFVDVFTNLGSTVRRLASHGTLNAPWGLAIAPDGFGKFTGDLLVGNFGDGRINVFRDGHFQGQLRDNDNKKITIDGLWALLPGTATTGGTGTLWFSAGPDDETHGLVGQLIPTN